MPALPTVVTDYLTAVKDSLKQGSDLGSNVRGAAQNYLRAQDMATVLDLLQDGLDQTAALTATGGTTTSVTDDAGTFDPGKQVGNVVTFDGNTTADLAGVTAVVYANDDRSLTFRTALPAAPASGDTYTLAGGLVDTAVSELRQGKGLADAPPGSVYGDTRIVTDALSLFAKQMGAVQATATLTASSNPADTDTVTIDGKTYTFQATLTDVDGNVHIGATASDSLDNLIAAINLGAGAGTAYATSTTLHPSVSAAAGTGDTMDVTAKEAVGPAGNDIAVSETSANLSWDDTTLTGGAFGSIAERTVSHAALQVGSGSTDTVVEIDTDAIGAEFRIDEFRGLKVTISGEEKIVVTNDNTSMTLSSALSTAPSAGTAFTLTVPEDSVRASSRSPVVAHPGRQPGNNAQLAELINTVETAVTNYTLPT